MKIVFLGTPEFSSITLHSIIGEYRPSLVITNPDRAAGRGQKIRESHLSETAKQLSLPLIKPEKLSQAIDEIEKISPDLIIVSAYGQYIPNRILEIPKFGAINLHPSLLPKYRGASPIQYAIYNGDDKTGATIILINEEMDKGDILAQREIALSGEEDYPSLLKELALIGGELLLETIPKWVDGKISPQKQVESEAVYSKILTRYDGKIDWKSDAERISRQVKAFNPWPGAYTFFRYKGEKEERLLKVLKGRPLKQTEVGPFGPPGKTYMATNGEIAVQTGKDFFIIEKFQLEGEKPINSSEYISRKIDLIGLTLI